MSKKVAIGDKVRSFYEELPFNWYESSGSAVERVKTENSIVYYRNLHELLTAGKVKTALEVGCGTGNFAAALGYHYKVKVSAFDFAGKAVERAKEVATGLGIEQVVHYMRADIFEHENLAQYDLVNCIGVLHHTQNCEEAFYRISEWVKPRMYLHIGLYHLYGRRVFLNLLRKEMEDKGEKAAQKLYMELNSHIKDNIFLNSWFRDQVLHPHETQHTLEEVAGWMKTAGFRLLSTSVNGFQRFESIDELITEEKKMEDISRRRNIKEKKYYPGFFTMLGQKIS